MSNLLRCCVRGCTTTSLQSETKLFSFPKFKDQCMAWVLFCNDSDLATRFTSGVRLDKSRVRLCANHFPKFCFRTPQKDKIFKGVIPSLNPPLLQDFDDVKLKTEPIDISSPKPSPGPSFASSLIPQSPPSFSVTSPFPGTSPAKSPPCLYPSDTGSPSPCPLSPFPGTSLPSAETPCLHPSNTGTPSPFPGTSLPSVKTPYLHPSNTGTPSRFPGTSLPSVKTPCFHSSNTGSPSPFPGTSLPSAETPCLHPSNTGTPSPFPGTSLPSVKTPCFHPSNTGSPSPFPGTSLPSVKTPCFHPSNTGSPSPFPGTSLPSTETPYLHPSNTGSPSPSLISPSDIGSPSPSLSLQFSDTGSSSPSPSSPFPDASLPSPAKTPPRFSLSDIGYKQLADCPSQTCLLLRYPRSKEIEIRNLIATCRKLKQKLKRMGGILSESGEDIINFIHRKLSPSAVTFINAHLRCAKKSPKGSRWTAEEKRMALALYKRSPKCYRLLCCMFVLPSIGTLCSMLSNIPFTTGINPQVLKCISRSLNMLPDCDRLCSLLFGEMSMREHLDYNQTTDMILGFEDYGHLGRNGIPAKYALVFMIRGVLKNWKQPIATYFSSNRTKADVLVVLINRVLQKCNEAGLRVICTICDMSSSNVKAVKGLGSTVQKPYFFHGGRQIVTIFDPPQLLKCTRNLLMSSDILVPVNTGCLTFEGRASWNDIKVIYHLDKQAELPFLYYLTDTHLNPIGKQKMRVDLAAQVFSYRVAATMLHYIARNEIPNAALGTATLVKIMDAVFDFCNGDDENAKQGKPLTYSMTEGSDHFQFLRDCISKMKKWKFVQKETEGARNHSDFHQPPSQKGWMVNLRGFMLLWRIVSNEKRTGKPVKKMSLRRFNKDPLENLFGAIRAQCGSNREPSVKQFIGAMKTCIVNGLATKAMVESNCKPDGASLLSDLGNLLQVHSRGTNEGSAEDPAEGVDVYYIHTGRHLRSEDKLRDDAAVGTVSFCVSVARTVLKKRNCEDCRAGIFNESSDTLSLGLREQLFTNPSEFFVNSLRNTLGSIRNILNNIAHEEHVLKTIFNCVKDEFCVTWLENFCCKHVEEVRHDILHVLISYSIMMWMKEKKS